MKKQLLILLILFLLPGGSLRAAEGQIDPDLFELAWDNKEDIWSLTFGAKTLIPLMEQQVFFGVGWWHFRHAPDILGSLSIGAILRPEFGSYFGVGLGVGWSLTFLEGNVEAWWYDLLGILAEWDLGLTFLETMEGGYGGGAFQLQLYAHGKVGADEKENLEIGLRYRAKNRVGLSLGWLFREVGEEGVMFGIFLK